MVAVKPYREKPTKKAPRLIVCQDCSKEFYTSNPGHPKYCLECGLKRYDANVLKQREKTRLRRANES